LDLPLASSRGPEYRYLVDCWRFYPDGFRALAKWAGVCLPEVSTDWGKIQVRIALLWVIRWECFADMLKQPLAGVGAFAAAVDPLVWYSRTAGIMPPIPSRQRATSRGRSQATERGVARTIRLNGSF